MNVPALAAERDLLHIPQSCQKCHAAHGEVLRRSQSIGHRQFQHQIDTALNGKKGTGELVQQGSITTLDEIAAHDGNDPLCTAAANLFQMIQVSVVQGIVFTDNSTDFHV